MNAKSANWLRWLLVLFMVRDAWEDFLAGAVENRFSLELPGAAWRNKLPRDPSTPQDDKSTK
jgi:hypothetical protein